MSKKLGYGILSAAGILAFGLSSGYFYLKANEIERHFEQFDTLEYLRQEDPYYNTKLYGSLAGAIGSCFLTAYSIKKSGVLDEINDKLDEFANTPEE